LDISFSEQNNVGRRQIQQPPDAQEAIAERTDD